MQSTQAHVVPPGDASAPPLQTTLVDPQPSGPPLGSQQQMMASSMQVAGQTPPSASASHQANHQSQQIHQPSQPSSQQTGYSTQLPQQPQLATQQQQLLHIQAQQGSQLQRLLHHSRNGGWQSDKDVQMRRMMIAKM
jgi:predicted DsbA family dithiol-disulfide isomerase